MLITIGGMRQLKEYTKQCHALYQSLQNKKKERVKIKMFHPVISSVQLKKTFKND